ncbi:hypothetical protein DXG03_004450, partial [Asterophora parasitica]
LQSSRDHLIELTVTRKNLDAFPQDPDGERERMKEIMAIIRRHILRCKSLRIHVVYTSSLPRVLNDFPDPAPDLISLSLEVAVPEIFHGLLDNAPIVTEFQLPWLQYLDIDAWNFVDLHRNALWWTEDLLNTRHLSYLTVALLLSQSYAPCTRDPRSF